MEREKYMGANLKKENFLKIFGKNKDKYLFVYGMLLLPVIQFCIFYIGINFNSIVMAF